jgi:hypothetical protein
LTAPTASAIRVGARHAPRSSTRWLSPFPLGDLPVVDDSSISDEREYGVEPRYSEFHTTTPPISSISVITRSWNQTSSDRPAVPEPPSLPVAPGDKPYYGVLLIDCAAGPAGGTADTCPILPGNARRPEALHEQFGKSVHRHGWMIRKRQIAHSAQEDSPPGVEVCLSHLGKLRLPGSMSLLSTLTTLNGHDIGPYLRRTPRRSAIRPNGSSHPRTSGVVQVSPRSRRVPRMVHMPVR